MKVFVCDYYENSRWEDSIDYYALITANTKTEALGLALQYYDDTIVDHWDIQIHDHTTITITDIKN